MSTKEYFEKLVEFYKESKVDLWIDDTEVKLTGFKTDKWFSVTPFESLFSFRVSFDDIKRIETNFVTGLNCVEIIVITK